MNNLNFPFQKNQEHPVFWKVEALFSVSLVTASFFRHSVSEGHAPGWGPGQNKAERNLTWIWSHLLEGIYVFADGNLAMKSLNHEQNLYQDFMLSTTCGIRGRKGQAIQVFVFWRSIQMCTVVNDTCSNINCKQMAIIAKEGNRRFFSYFQNGTSKAKFLTVRASWR